MSLLQQALSAVVQKTDDIFVTELDGIEILFRLPSIYEAQKYSTMLSLCQQESEHSEIYEFIFRHVAIDSFLANNNGEIPAGIPETIAKLALYLSGINEQSEEYTQNLWNEHRKHATDTINFMKSIICTAFGGYTFESLDQLDYHKLTYLFVQAELILIDTKIIEQPYTFINKKDNIQGNKQNNNLQDIGKNTNRKRDPRSEQIHAKLREMAIKRAEEEENAYRQKYNG